MVKIAQTFAFGRKKANQGGLPGLTIGFFQQSLDSWRAFVIFVQFILEWKPLRLTRLQSPILHDELHERSDGSTTVHSSKIISNQTLNVLWCYLEVQYKTPDLQRNCGMFATVAVWSAVCFKIMTRYTCGFFPRVLAFYFQVYDHFLTNAHI